jgi:hypothetical protein
MNKRTVLIAALALLVLVAVPVVWWLAAPLFIDKTVDEAFPFDMPSASQLAEMSEEEVRQLVVDFEAAIPSAEALAAMPAEAVAQMEQQAQELAAVMPDAQVEDPMPEASEPVVVAQGEFVGADSFHQGAGQAKIYSLPDGTHVLRFENFDVTNGPDLHVLLATGAQPATSDDLGEYIDLGKLKGNMGNQNYEIPADVDPSRFQSIVIYCQPFHVVFATATLN